MYSQTWTISGRQAVPGSGGRCPAPSPLRSLLPFSPPTGPIDLATVEMAVVARVPLPARCQNSQASGTSGFFVGLYLYNRLFLGRQPDTKLAARIEEVSPLPGGQPGPRHTGTIGTKVLFILQSPGRKSRLSHLKKKKTVLTTAQPLLPICSACNL